MPNTSTLSQLGFGRLFAAGLAGYSGTPAIVGNWTNRRLDLEWAKKPGSAAGLRSAIQLLASLFLADYLDSNRRRAGGDHVDCISSAP